MLLGMSGPTGVRDACARSIVDASRRAYALLVSSARGTRQNAGSHSFALRSMNALRSVSAIRCAYAALPKLGSVSYVSSWCRISNDVVPPDDTGGMPNTVYPRYVVRSGSRQIAL